MAPVIVILVILASALTLVGAIVWKVLKGPMPPVAPPPMEATSPSSETDTDSATSAAIQDMALAFSKLPPPPMELRQIFPQTHEAAAEIFSMVRTYSRMAVDRWNPQEAVAAAALLAGTCMLRSLNLDVLKSPLSPPGTVLLSEEANQRWPLLDAVMCGFIEHNGIRIDPRRTIYKSPAPADPWIFTPRALEIQKDLQQRYEAIRLRHGLDGVQGSYAGALACGALITNLSRHGIDPYPFCNIALMCFIAGMKTIPPPMAGGQQAG